MYNNTAKQLYIEDNIKFCCKFIFLVYVMFENYTNQKIYMPFLKSDLFVDELLIKPVYFIKLFILQIKARYYQQKMFFDQISIFFFCIRINTNHSFGYSQKKDLDINLREVNKYNFDFCFKIVTR